MNGNLLVNEKEFLDECIVIGNGLVKGGMEICELMVMNWWMNCERIFNGGNYEWMEINVKEL